MPPVAAAVVPHPPLLVPELAGAAAGELDPHQQDPAVDRVDHGTAHQRAQQQGAELRQPHQPDRQRGARLQVHLQRHRHHGQLASQEGQQLAGVEQAVLG